MFKVLIIQKITVNCNCFLNNFISFWYQFFNSSFVEFLFTFYDTSVHQKLKFWMNIFLIWDKSFEYAEGIGLIKGLMM